MYTPRKSHLIWLAFAVALFSYAMWRPITFVADPSSALPVETACMVRVERAREALASSPHDLDFELDLARQLGHCGQDMEAVAWYEQLLLAAPRDAPVWYEMGEALLRSAQPDQVREAARAFAKVLALNPGNAGAELGLAQAESKLGRWGGALGLYRKVLAQNPANYDALQGKAFILYWTHHFAQAQAIFQSLRRLNPDDTENQKALALLAQAVDRARWAALRPPASASPQAWMGYEISYLASHPNDRAALERLARAEARLGIYTSAVRNDQHALRLAPSDAAAQEQMAMTLAWDQRFAASIQASNELLLRDPENRAALASQAVVYVWSGRFKEALSAEKKLLALDPGNTSDELEIARLQLRLKDTKSVRRTLNDLLAQHPENREARIERAGIELDQNDLSGALQDYNAILALNFRDADASYGAARVYYYLGQPDRAYPLAFRAGEERPKDFDALLLCARIERARHHTRQARALLARASRLDPSNPEIGELRAQMQSEHRVTVETSSSYAREVAVQNPLTNAPGGYSPARTVEDLNSYGSSIRTGFTFLPRSSSYVLVAASPSNSPIGGIQGAVAPAELMYGQTTRLSSFVTLRAGFGIARLGPGAIPAYNPPGEPVRAVATRALAAVGYVGYSLFPARGLSFDLSASRAANTATPTSVRLGVMETRLSAGIHYAINSRTSIAGSFDHVVDSSPVFYELYTPDLFALLRHGREQGNQGRLVFDRNLIRTDRFSLDAGYAGLAFGFAGVYPLSYMGFFSPAFYQQHFATIHVSDVVYGPVRLTFDGGAGAQQVENGAAFTQAFKIHPALSFRVSRNLDVTLGYMYYNFSEALGTVRGNAVTLTTDWSF